MPVNFDHYDKGTVYDLRLSNGERQTLLVEDQDADVLKGKVADLPERHPNAVRVGEKTAAFRKSAIIGKRRAGKPDDFDVTTGRYFDDEEQDAQEPVADGGRDVLAEDLPEFTVDVREVPVREGDDVTTSWRAEADGYDVTAGGDTATEAVDVLLQSIQGGSDE